MTRSRVWEIAFLLLVGWTCSPLWAAKYLPIQDLPQHLAAIRVLHSFTDPQFDFGKYFELQLFRTQYLVYYLAADLLAYVFDLELANRILMTLCVAFVPYALRSLLRALGRDERFALFALPLTYNAHLILGFVNFLLAIGLALWGLSLAVRIRMESGRPHKVVLLQQIALAATALACFYAHVVPFALMALGVGLIALGRDVRATVVRLLPLAPAGLAALIWMVASPAGQATVRAANGAEAGPQAQFTAADIAYADIPNWLTDILHGDTDRTLLKWFAFLFTLTLCSGLWPRREGDEPPSPARSRAQPERGPAPEIAADAPRASRQAAERAASGAAGARETKPRVAGGAASPRDTSAQPESQPRGAGAEPASAELSLRDTHERRMLSSSLAIRLLVLPLASALLYFIAPTGYDWIWPIAQRFPLLALLFAIPVFPRPGRVLGAVATVALVALTLANVREVSRAFHAFDAEEVGDFDAALDSIPPAKRVVGLIFARGSRQVKFSPFIQYVAYYQARKGGAVMFTFADFPQSPFRFREDNRPPRVPPRWEWMPHLVRRGAIDWYEYLLVRAGPSPCLRERARCRQVYRGRVWDVWELL